MRLSPVIAVGVLSLTGVVLAAEPPKQTGAARPPWQRYLQGKDQAAAEGLEKQLMALQQAGRFVEALPVAERLVDLRSRIQGKDHWEAVDSRMRVEALRRVLQQPKALQTEYSHDLGLQAQAEALEHRGRYREAQPLRERILIITRKALGEQHPDTGRAYNDLALNQKTQGKYREAEEGYKKALAIRRKALGEDHPDTAMSYNNLAASQRAQGKYRDAEALFRKALAIHRQVLGDEHPYTAMNYDNLAGTLKDRGNYREAEEDYRKALAIFRKVLGDEHPDTAISYGGLANVLQAEAKYREAEAAFRKDLDINRKVLGENHPNTATGYNNLALNQKAQGKYREAEAGFRKALAIDRRVLGEQHPATAACYNNLASVLDAQGRFREAEDLFHKALAIHRKVFGEEHPATAGSYNNLAGNQQAQGKYREAEENCRKTLAIDRKVLGDEHPSTVTTYNNLAACEQAQGKFREAEDGYRKSLAIFRKVLGEEHPATASGYNNLALVQNAQGKYQEAEEGYRRALAISRKVLGENHPDTAASYDGLATNLAHQEKYRAAEEGYEKALAIRLKVLGGEHPDTATSYNNLALAQDAQGKYRAAEEGFRKALAIHRKVFGEEHPRTAANYNNLAFCQGHQGKYREAEAEARKALAILRKVFGEQYPSTALSYSVLALNQYAQGKYREAQALWLHAAQAFGQARVQAVATGLQGAAFERAYSPVPWLVAILARNGQPADAWQWYEQSLARGTWDDLSTRLRIPKEDYDKQQELSSRIDRLNQRLAQLRPEQADLRQQFLTELRQRNETLAALRHELEKKYGPVAGQVFSWKQVQQALPPDAALLGWADLPGQPQAADPNGEHWALLLRSTGAPVCVRLAGSGKDGTWTEADNRLPGRLRAALQIPGSNWRPLARQLDRQRLEPVRQQLQGVHQLIGLPSWQMAGIPLELLAEDYTVSSSHSGTLYAFLRQRPRPTSQGLLALADPVFEAPAIKPVSLPPGGVLLVSVLPGSNAARAGLRARDVLLRYGDNSLSGPADLAPALQQAGAATRRVPVQIWRDGHRLSRPLFIQPGRLGVVLARQPAPQALAAERELEQQVSTRGEHWARLAGSRLEASALQQVFAGQPTTVLLGSQASEQKLSELAQAGVLAQYRYLHLATHGEMNARFPMRSAIILAQDHLPSAAQRVQLLQAGEPIPDGRLTAEEVLQHWHLDCELVTLSACQTALGKYEGGEGFVGFAQALALAGSRTVCLSLWKVDDTATALLMQRFYQNLLGKRKDLHAPLAKAAALAEAKHWLRQLTRDEALQLAAHLSDGVPRGKHSAPRPLGLPAAHAQAGRPFAHPYYWAAFVLIGRAD